LREEDARLHPGRLRRSRQPPVRPRTRHTGAGSGVRNIRSARHTRRAVRANLSRASVLRRTGYRAGAAAPHPHRRAPAAGRPAVTAATSLVAVVCALTFVHFAAAQMRGPLVPLYAVAHGATATGVGFIVAAHMEIGRASCRERA